MEKRAKDPERSADDLTRQQLGICHWPLATKPDGDLLSLDIKSFAASLSLFYLVLANRSIIHHPAITIDTIITDHRRRTHPPSSSIIIIMKLNITLLSVTLATAGCCSPFALSPGRQAATSNHRVVGSGGFDKAAFVRPDAAAPFASSTTTLHSTSAVAAASSSGDNTSSAGIVQSTRGGGSAATSPFGIDIPLLAYFGLWYLGNYYYNITNKLALKAVGGASGFPLTISTLQLGIGSLYGLFLWLAPDAREKPKITLDDVSVYDTACTVTLCCLWILSLILGLSIRDEYHYCIDETATYF